MRKYTILALALALCGAMLVGCGCMNSGAEMTTAPTTASTTTAPTTSAPTTQATTMPTTMPETESTAMDGNTHETAGEDGIVDTEPSETGGGAGNAKSRSTHRMPPMG